MNSFSGFLFLFTIVTTMVVMLTVATPAPNQYTQTVSVGASLASKPSFASIASKPTSSLDSYNEYNQTQPDNWECSSPCEGAFCYAGEYPQCCYVREKCACCKKDFQTTG